MIHSGIVVGLRIRHLRLGTWVLETTRYLEREDKWEYTIDGRVNIPIYYTLVYTGYPVSDGYPPRSALQNCTKAMTVQGEIAPPLFQDVFPLYLAI